MRFVAYFGNSIASHVSVSSLLFIQPEPLCAVQHPPFVTFISRLRELSSEHTRTVRICQCFTFFFHSLFSSRFLVLVVSYCYLYLFYNNISSMCMFFSTLAWSHHIHHSKYLPILSNGWWKIRNRPNEKRNASTTKKTKWFVRTTHTLSLTHPPALTSSEQARTTQTSRIHDVQRRDGLH